MGRPLVLLFTLFLHKDWTRLLRINNDPKQYNELSSSAKRVISVSTTQPGLVTFLSSVIVPLASLFYIIFSLAFAAMRFSQWKMTRRDGLNGGIPCFELGQTGEGVRKAMLSVNLISTIFAGSGFVSTIAILVIASLGRPYASFIMWWMRRNYGFCIWCIFRGTLGALTGAESVADLVLIFLTPPIFSSLDFLILTSSGGAWALRGYRAFYFLNGTSLIMSYLMAIAARNQCEVVKNSASINALLALSAIAGAGQLVSLIKLHLQKLRRIFPPSLRYGLASHVQVSLPSAGSKAVLILGAGDVTIAPAETVDLAASTAGGSVPFIVPSQRFWGYLSLWSVLALSWLSLSLAFNIINTTRFRAYAKERCWTTRARPHGLFSFDLLLTGVLSVMVGTLITLLVTNSLGGLALRWMRYWVRRNWIFIILCVARGLVMFKPDVPGAGVGDGITYLVTYAVALPIGLSTIDLLLTLQSRRIIVILARVYILVQLFVACAGYVEGLASDSPCDQGAVSKNKAIVVLSKIRTTVLLLFSLQYLTMLIAIKILTGITVPIIKFSDEDRFSQSTLLPSHRGSMPVMPIDLVEDARQSKEFDGEPVSESEVAYQDDDDEEYEESYNAGDNEEEEKEEDEEDYDNNEFVGDYDQDTFYDR